VCTPDDVDAATDKVSDAMTVLDGEGERRKGRLGKADSAQRERRHQRRRASDDPARARHVDLLESAPIAYCTLDRAGLILELNLTGASLLGQERPQLIGAPFVRHVAPDSRAVFREHMLRCVEGAPRVSTEVTLLSDSQEGRAVQVVSVPAQRTPAGEVGYRTVLADITEPRRREDGLRLAVRARQDFLAIVAHDLRSPLNAIVILADLLLRTDHVPDRRRVARQRVLAVRRAAGRMDRLVSDLLDLSGMEAGRLSIDWGVHDVVDLFETVLELTRPLAAERRIELHRAPLLADMKACCDRERVIQVLANLVDNAIKFTEPGGKVTLAARQERGGVCCSVVDTGRGIAPEHLRHIFKPYWRAEKPTCKGAGLGLAIARGIVEGHGSELSVRSEVGRGTTFSFVLPARVAGLRTPPS
jgi:PAS domain S-box-containing protein